MILCAILLMFVKDLVIAKENASSPNIVFIMADDLGWDDVSFHGSNQILTPNIDLLAYTGMALGRYYSHCLCTPSRSALLTGKYAHTLGMQGYPLTNGEDRGLPITEKILPQYLKEHGYATHLVGKWHVGHSREEYLPTNRGFDSHFGHRGGFVDYYEYTLEETWSNGKVSGLDLYRNLTADWSSEGYITDLYNKEAKSIIMDHDSSKPLFLMVTHSAPHSGNDGAPLQAPPEEVRAMRHVESPERRIYAAMVKKLDDSVGDIVKTLDIKGILENTIIVFVSDNGGITSGATVNYASNWPLRGLKMTPFEGGIRVAGLVWTSNMDKVSHLWNGYMHVTDWLPTLLRATGVEPPEDIDGIDQWNAILDDKKSAREELFEIDDFDGFAAIVSGNYKLIIGNLTSEQSYYYGGDLRGVIDNGPSYSDALKNSHVYDVLRKNCDPFNMEKVCLRNDIKVECTKEKTNLCIPENGKICLYDLKEDPCESENISGQHPEIVSKLKARLESEMKRLKPRVKPIFKDPKAAPSLHNFTWSSWL